MGVKRALGLTIAVLTLVLGLGGCSLPKIVTPSAKAETSQAQQTQDYEESKRLAQERQDKTFDYYNSLGLNLPKLKVSDYQGFEQIKPDLEQRLGFPIPYSLELTEEIREFTARTTNRERTPIDKLEALCRFIHKNNEIEMEKEYSPSELVEIFNRGTIKNTIRGNKTINTLYGDCSSLSKLFAVCASTIPGVQEVYVCDVVRDTDGRNFNIKHVNDEYGFRHVCNVVKVDGEWIIIDVTKPRGLRYPYAEIAIQNQIEIRTHSMIKKANNIRATGDYKGFVNMRKSTLRIDPYDSYLYYVVGGMIRGEDPTKAFLYLVKADELKPNDFSYLQELALAYRGLKEYDLALSKIKACLELCPEYGEGYYTYALILAEMGKLDKARKIFRKGMEFQPIDPDDDIPLEFYNIYPDELKKK